MRKLIRFFKDEEGATAVEYAIMVALIAIVIIAAVVLVGKKANNAFSAVASAMPTQDCYWWVYHNYSKDNDHLPLQSDGRWLIPL